MNRLQRSNWANTFSNMTVDEKLILLQGFYEALEEVLELVDEVMFDTDITHEKALKEIQSFLRQELREIPA